MENKIEKPKLFDVLKPYSWLTSGLILLGFATNGLNLFLPRIISTGIDEYTKTGTILNTLIWEFFFVSFGTFIFAYLQSIAQTYTSEKVAFDLRKKVVSKISEQEYTYIQKIGSGKLLTNLTSDIDNIKNFVGQAVVSIISSVFLVLGASILMLYTNWKLGLAVLSVLPFISLIFILIFRKLSGVFKKSQEIIDWLNKIINESVLGSSIIRVLNSKDTENIKFVEANTKAKEVGIKIIGYFAMTFPIINLIANLATLTILLLGGHYIINDTLTIGEFSAFITYLGLIIFPLIMIGFLSNSISRASASYSRIFETLNSQEKNTSGNLKGKITGNIKLENVNLFFGEKNNEKVILKDISFEILPGSKTAILGPTAAGKTQLMNILIGILPPSKGNVLYDGVSITKYDPETLHEQVSLVFQDSIMFNMSLRENIAFSNTVKDMDLKKALDTAELTGFIDTLPQKLDTMVMERGTSLSGGQKQRIMLARTLALNPKVLLLDDFTARVDNNTEKKILNNIKQNYPYLTLISVTQKISSILDYDQIILLMEGEVLAKGTHEELMKISPEYVQIFESQKSTNYYELQT